jgi:protein arginine kinase
MELSGLIPADAINRGPQWLSGTGRDADVVISSRIRLARNLAGRPFPARSTLALRAATLQTIRDHLLSGAIPLADGGAAAAPGAIAGALPRLAWADVHTMSALDRSLLVERHLMSKEHAKGKGLSGSTLATALAAAAGPAATGAAGEAKTRPPESQTSLPDPRGIAVSLPDETLAVMVNEEDHLRVQVLLSGLSLTQAWARIDAVDDAIEGVGGVAAARGVNAASTAGGLHYAYSPRFGYLTACPTNVGCAVRMSVMVHLPGLRLTAEIEKVRRACKDMNLALRGFYGEGSETSGDLYQISNQGAFGKPEKSVLHEIEREIVPAIVRFERTARQTLLTTRRLMLEDQVMRALGLLRYARMLTPEEALASLSLVRLGSLLGIVDIPEQAVAQLIVLTQPAHLQRYLGKELDQQRRREARADLVRERMS